MLHHQSLVCPRFEIAVKAWLVCIDARIHAKERSCGITIRRVVVSVMVVTICLFLLGGFFLVSVRRFPETSDCSVRHA